MKIKPHKLNTAFKLTAMASAIFSTLAYASPVTGPLNLSNAPLFTTSASKPNILVILDNSNSMDEDSAGAAVGGASINSKSEIARGVIKDQLIPSYLGRINLGLMAYEQASMISSHVHNAPYDASFNPSNYDPYYTGDRDSLVKRFRTPHHSDPGKYVYFNVNLPFYSSSNQGNGFLLFVNR